jgi:endonuclease I
VGAIGIDWRSASVRDGRLTVPLTERAPSEWAESVEAVIGRLRRGGRGWGEIEISKKRLRVDAVQPGTEADLHHFLESAVLQVNADRGYDEEDEETADDADGGSDEDRRMTEAFQAFGD